MKTKEYEHKTTNHLFFDLIRNVQMDVDLISAYLQRENDSRIGGAGLDSIILALNKASVLLFDDVYKPLRELWE